MRRKVALITIMVILLTMLTACAKPEKQLSVTELLDLGEKYLLEMNYEQAVVQFLKVIEIEPKNPRGYTGAAEAYVGLGQIDEAIAVLRQGQEQLPDDVTIKEMISKLIWDSFTPEQKTMLDRLEFAANDFDHETAFEIMSSTDFLELYTQLGIDRGGDKDYAYYKKDGKTEFYSIDCIDDNKEYRWRYHDSNGNLISCDFWLEDSDISIRHMSMTQGKANGKYTKVYWCPDRADLRRYEGIAVDDLIHGTEVETHLLTGERYILNWDHGICTNNFLVDELGRKIIQSESGNDYQLFPEDPGGRMYAYSVH